VANPKACWVYWEEAAKKKLRLHWWRPARKLGWTRQMCRAAS